jgi:hypothetical protein
LRSDPPTNRRQLPGRRKRCLRLDTFSQDFSHHVQAGFEASGHRPMAGETRGEQMQKKPRFLASMQHGFSHPTQLVFRPENLNSRSSSRT